MEENKIEYSCPNCKHTFLLEDQFCANCGQKKIKGEFRLKTLIGHFFEDYFSFDNKILTTIKKLIINPGRLTKDFFEGKRASNVLPLRLYLFVAFISVFSISMINNSSGGNPFEFEISQGFEEGANDGVEKDNNAKDLGKEVGKEIGYVVREKSSIFILLELPILAFFIYLFFYKKNRYYMESFVMALHTQTFFFITLLFAFLFDFVIDFENGILIFIGPLSYFIYTSIALKIYYKTNYLSTIVKLLLIQVLQVTVILTMMICYVLVKAFFQGII